MTNPLIEESPAVERAEAFEDARSAPPEAGGPGWQQAATRLVENPRFGTLVISVILANAATLAVATFSQISSRVGPQLTALDHAFLAFFCAELTLRLAAVGFRPERFLRRGWNAFDLLAVGAAFVPGLGANATALRMVRMLRVARLLSVLPDVRVLLVGLRRAARPAAGILLLTLLIIYLYGIIGWSLFRDADPGRWGDIGLAMLSLFQLLTHHDWPTILDPLREHSPFAVTYVVSFIIITAFLIVQFLVAVVLTSLEQAHEERREELRLAREAVEPRSRVDPITAAKVGAQVTALRAALEQLEARQRDSRRAPV